MKKPEACLLCGEPLIYERESREMECTYCHKRFMSNAACKNGHYVCDRCHAAQAIADIKRLCLQSESRDPLSIAVSMMETPFTHMHGPEHHVLVGAALLAAYHNSGGAVDMEHALAELVKRGGQVPGGACGFWGCCGAAVGAGIFVSVVTGSTPMATEAFGLSNRMTAAALSAIGEIGGPRCCKRDTFLAIRQAVPFCKAHLHVEMELPERFVCRFFSRNPQCITKRCPFHPAAE